MSHCILILYCGIHSAGPSVYTFSDVLHGWGAKGWEIELGVPPIS